MVSRACGWRERRVWGGWGERLVHSKHARKGSSVAIARSGLSLRRCALLAGQEEVPAWAGQRAGRPARPAQRPHQQVWPALQQLAPRPLSRCLLAASPPPSSAPLALLLLLLLLPLLLPDMPFCSHRLDWHPGRVPDLALFMICAHRRLPVIYTSLSHDPHTAQAPATSLRPHGMRAGASRVLGCALRSVSTGP